MPRWFPLLLAFLVPGALVAGTFDIDASALHVPVNVAATDKTVVVKANSAAFEKLMAEVGVAMGPKMIGPARTLGLLGFDVGYTVAITNINETADYWTTATAKPTNFLPTMQLNLTKGLPYSFQIEGLITHMFSSGVWAMGLNVKWALLEGYKYAPEVSLSAHVGTLTGTKNYTLLTFGGAALVSKRFGIGGLVEVSPYAGYNALAGRAASEVLYHFVSADENPFDKPADFPETFVIPPTVFLRSLGVFGIVVTGGIVSGGFETMVTSGLQTFSFKASVTF